ncbi:fungal-specific actin related protein [Macrolepiota fuliginosa MF-IS2]|uniref:Fungal-specific actin related protein n=1 Tax=Macrolepiota fuliginosa MF-IS2 TaxID=1400762 RepID=A0A9P5XN07_9AGAR|nr:fungal-specific actin related protein [Macrolepiota fuliginosa MF-IS2]
MSAQPTTPTSRTANHPTTPATSRIANTHIIQASPHYTTTRRHSLYGVEDRIIIDPGSRIWKVGFSGEGKPRDVFHAVGPNDTLWNLSRAADPFERTEEDKMLEIRLQKCLRSVFHDSLMTDPKARKVIVVEHPLLPLYIKDLIARILFDNQVPSVSFASSHLLSLLSVGRITGLVVDSGHLESVALPIFASRPLFPQLRTTPLAGARLTQHLRALLLMFATYLPPLASLGSTTVVPNADRATRVPQEILTDQLVEEIKTRYCFVSGIMPDLQDDGDAFKDIPMAEDDDDFEPEVPPSDSIAPSESEFSTADSENTDAPPSQAEASESERPRAPSSLGSVPSEGHLQGIANLYRRHSQATSVQMRVTPPQSQQQGTGQGTLVIPGWIRERAAEVLFEGGDIDESSLAELILDVLLKTPMDLRKTLACSVLVTGGTAMLPGFIPRLHAEILRAIQPPMVNGNRNPGYPTVPWKPPPPVYDRYASLRTLVPYISILNNPSPPPATSSRVAANAGKAPAFAPSLMAWVGGSLAGSLKTGGAEVSREKWDEADAAAQSAEDEEMEVAPETPNRPRSILPDWTRSPLPVGASPANAKPPATPPTPHTPQATRIAAR